MRKSLFRAFLFAASFALVAGGLLSACGDPAAPGGKDDPRDQKKTKPPPQDGRIVHVAPCPAGQNGMDAASICSVERSYNTEHPLKAKVLTGDGNPAPDRVVHYEIVSQDESGLVNLLSKQQTTEDNGVAETTIVMSPDTTGNAKVKAYTNDENLGTVYWNIRVSPKGMAEYEVHVVYEGEAEVNQTEVAIFKSDKTCDQLRSKWAIRRNDSFDRTQLPTNITSKTEPLNPSGNKLERTFYFSENLEKQKAYTVWARSFKLKGNNKNEPDVELAWGCKDMNDKLGELENVQVEIKLKDHIPLLKEKYDVVHHFDLLNALPDKVEKWIRLLGLAVRSPGAFLVGCDSDDTYEVGNTTKKLCPHLKMGESMDGLLIELLGFLGNSNSTIKGWIQDLKNNDLINETLRTAVDEVVFKLVGKNEFADTAVKVTRDIFDSLQNFGVKGPMRFMNQPMPTYQNGEAVLQIPKDGAMQAWHEFAFYWQKDQMCEKAQDFQACRTSWFLAQEIMEGQDSAIEGKFSATMTGSQDLHINQHKLKFNFGALLIGVVEHVVLPRYFSKAANNGGDVVKDLDTDPADGTVTLEELLGGTIADCGKVAKKVGTFEDTIEKVCKGLRKKLVEKFEEMLIKQLSFESDNVTIGSPQGKPCTIYQPGVYPDSWNNQPLPFIDRLGKQDKGKQCDWDVKFSFADSVPGTFYGTTN